MVTAAKYWRQRCHQGERELWRGYRLRHGMPAAALCWSERWGYRILCLNVQLAVWFSCRIFDHSCRTLLYNTYISPHTSTYINCFTSVMRQSSMITDIPLISFRRIAMNAHTPSFIVYACISHEEHRSQTFDSNTYTLHCTILVLTPPAPLTPIQQV